MRNYFMYLFLVLIILASNRLNAQSAQNLKVDSNLMNTIDTISCGTVFKHGICEAGLTYLQTEDDFYNVYRTFHYPNMFVDVYQHPEGVNDRNLIFNYQYKSEKVEVVVKYEDIKIDIVKDVALLKNIVFENFLLHKFKFSRKMKVGAKQLRGEYYLYKNNVLLSTEIVK